jgi:nucleoside-diphosphate kinase
MAETTLVLIKPGAVARGLTGKVVSRIEARGLKVVGMKLINAERATVEAHYEEHVGKPFYESVVNSLTSAPIVALAVQGENAVQAIRTMMGATNPVDAAPGTVRGDFGLTIEDNICHSAADVDAAPRELGLWFPEGLVS